MPCWTAAQWERSLPTWDSRDADRGLKEWRSTADKGGWVVPGVCAKVINAALDVYMTIYAVPPVFEGEMKNGVLQRKSSGIDLFKRFLLTVGNTSPKHTFKTSLQNTSSSKILYSGTSRVLQVFDPQSGETPGRTQAPFEVLPYAVCHAKAFTRGEYMVCLAMTMLCIPSSRTFARPHTVPDSFQ